MLQPTLLPDVPVTLVVLPFSATAEAVILGLVCHMYLRETQSLGVAQRADMSG
jgi:hypothetical protein